MLDLRAVETLRRVAALGSFSAAGADLHLTQPAVSRQVALLEQRLGTRLVLRSRRGVRLTPAGRVVLSHADAIHARLGRLEAELGALAGDGQVALRLGAHSTA